jgi:hypothetical protein
MFAKTIVLSDAFLDMPLSARCLYFTLGMFADDDGFVNSPKGIMRQCGASEDDIKILMSKKFLLAFESGVIVIKHWRINNYLRNDRYQETKYLEEKSELSYDENGAYTFGIPNSGIPSIGKDSIDKYSIYKEKEISKDISKKKNFIPPSVEEVKEYLLSVGSKVDAEAFVAFYESKDWMIGKNKMKNWKSAIVTWEKRNGLKREKVSRKVTNADEEPEIDLWSD